MTKPIQQGIKVNNHFACNTHRQGLGTLSLPECWRHLHVHIFIHVHCNVYCRVNIQSSAAVLYAVKVYRVVRC
jgi:hypothetical protein